MIGHFDVVGAVVMERARQTALFDFLSKLPVASDASEIVLRARWQIEAGTGDSVLLWGSEPVSRVRRSGTSVVTVALA